MLFDAALSKVIDAIATDATRVQAEGFDGGWVGETRHDPFMQVMEAGRATSTLQLGTAVAIAFARNPMTVANSAYDLAAFTSGRFVLGLGSQVKAHIERRFAMPWSSPAARMRDFVLALRAIWTAWSDGTQLDFHGQFYTHTLMTPFFAPPAHQWGAPPVFLAGVGPRMTEVAGEVADGFFVHAFSTPRYIAEVTVPALMCGRQRIGRDDLEGFSLAGPVFACVGRDDAELAAAIVGTRAQIAFYASTPGYRSVLDLHGWGDAQHELTRLSKAGRWLDMGAVVDDEMLHAFAVVGDPETVGRQIATRYSNLMDRVSFYAPYPHDPSVWPDVLAAARAATTPTAVSEGHT
jgi:probable F420-dependent oxidoreductase